MSRGTPSAFAAAVAGGHAAVFTLLEFGFDSGTTYVAGLDHDVVWNGATYLAALGLISIGSAAETAATSNGLTVSIAGATPASLGLALGTPVQGRPFVMRLAALDGAGAVQVDPAAWVGAMDVLSISDAVGGATISITVEPRTAAWARPRQEVYSDAWQIARASGDRSLRYTADIASRTLAWPAKEFFYV